MTLTHLAQATVIEPSKASRATPVLFATVELAYRTQAGFCKDAIRYIFPSPPGPSSRCRKIESLAVFDEMPVRAVCA